MSERWYGRNNISSFSTICLNELELKDLVEAFYLYKASKIEFEEFEKVFNKCLKKIINQKN